MGHTVYAVIYSVHSLLWCCTRKFTAPCCGDIRALRRGGREQDKNNVADYLGFIITTQGIVHNSF